MESLEVTQQRHGNDSGKGRCGQADCLTRDIKLKHRVKAHNAPDQHHHELLKQYAERDADDDAAQPCVQRLTAQHKADAALAHAEDVIQTQLLTAALHQEAVGIAQEYHDKKRQYKAAKRHEHHQIVIALLPRQIVVIGQRRHNIERRRADNNCQQIREIELAVFYYILPCKLGVKELIHRGRLSGGASACRISWRTYPPRPSRRGRSGGTPRRP